MDSGVDFALHWGALVVGLVLIGPYVFVVFSQRIHEGEFAKQINKLLMLGDVQRAKKLAQVSDGPLCAATNVALTRVLDGSALRQDQAEDYRASAATIDPEVVKQRLRSAFIVAFDDARKGRWARRAMAAVGACLFAVVAADLARRPLLGPPLAGSAIGLLTMFWTVRRDAAERGAAVAMFARIEDAMYVCAIGPPPSPTPLAPLAIIVEEPGEPAREVAIDQPVIKIGRIGTAQILLSSEQVSRLHAVIENDEGVLSIIDLGSATGTQVNGDPINKRALRDGDRITIGPCVLTVRARS
ncbi:MAG: FHA domain-containing protein [Deltaproteobacteria bacterium]|nr:FHA domain-containing protein [Deltaproteobacteria bacterium]